MRFNRVVSTEFMAVMGSGAAMGFLVGIGLASLIFVSRAGELSRLLEQKVARIVVLEALVSRPPDFAALEGPAIEAETPELAPAATQVAAGPRVSMSAPVPVPRPVAPPSVAVANTPPVATPLPRSPVRTPSPARQSDAVTAEEIAAAVATSKVEGVPADKARVAKITADGVYLSSGKLIRPGERFSSGERLLQVDPANNRVVTSERQLLLFFSN